MRKGGVFRGTQSCVSENLKPEEGCGKLEVGGELIRPKNSRNGPVNTSFGPIKKKVRRIGSDA